jgi:hypothetical protein
MSELQETFEREISFLGKTFIEEENRFEEGKIVKTAKFKELSRTDRSQHKLHFSIIALMESFGIKDAEDAKMKIDSDGIYDLSVKSFETLLVPGCISDSDKIEFLNDSAAIFNFGFSILGEKIAPFFSEFLR